MVLPVCCICQKTGRENKKKIFSFYNQYQVFAVQIMGVVYVKRQAEKEDKICTTLANLNIKISTLHPNQT
jgi:hypothetical protein